jgi:enoyl-CoA hydratase/carnithine racemase
MIQYEVSDGVCVLRLNCPPLNTLTYPLLDDLCESIDRAGADAAVRAIVITGNAKHFSAGADVNLFEKIESRQDAVRVSQVFQEAFSRIEDSQKPVAAALAGKVLGGALELAMACHFRVCTEETNFSMPEVNLGINPGAGGTARLPRLVGVPSALEMLLSGRPVDARRALHLGLVDAVSSADELQETAKRIILSAHAPRKTRTLDEKISDRATNAAALDRVHEKLAAVRPEIIAPRKPTAQCRKTTGA